VTELVKPTFALRGTLAVAGGVEALRRGAAEALFGRDCELALVAAFLDRARTAGAALLLSGEVGAGKTALLHAAAGTAMAAGTRVLRAGGAEFEAGLSFSALNQVLLPLRGEFAELGPAHHDALNVALGLDDGPASDRLTVSNAALELLVQSAAARPVLVVLDDLQWLDRASAAVLGFVARRLGGSHVGLLAASRSGQASFLERAGLPELDLGPLGDKAARALLRVRFPALSAGVRERLLAEAQGNPLALLELPAALSGRQQTAVEALPTVLPVRQRLRVLFASWMAGLPARTRQLLLAVALDGTGDLRVLDLAGTQALEDLAVAERARLVSVSGIPRRLAFRHPLIRPAVVDLATEEERRAAHRALADLWPDRPDRRAWHLAEAAAGPDEEVAGLLEQSAHYVLRRADAAAAMAALTRAADLSPAGPDRGRRLAEAAFIGAEATGQLGSVSTLLADACQSDPALIGSLHAAAAAVYLLLMSDDGDIATAHQLLVGAIQTADHGYDTHDGGLIEAMHTLALVCWVGGRPELWEPFYDALARLKPGPPGVLSVLAKTLPDPARTAAAAQDERKALVATLRGRNDPAEVLRLGTSSVYIDGLGDLRTDTWRLVRQGRGGGPSRTYIASLIHLCLDDFLTGQWEEADQLAEEGLAALEHNGCRFPAWHFLYTQAMLAAVRGDHVASRALADRITGWAVPRAAYGAEARARHPRVLSAIGKGDFEDAYRHATALGPAGTLPSYTPHALWVAFDLVEAAIRTGRHAEAAAHVAAMAGAGIAAISPRLAVLHYGASAITAPESHASDAFGRALSVPDATRWPFDLARVQLAYGEHLRRGRALAESRTHLAAALETFDRLGARPWADRAAGELRATGQTRPRTCNQVRLALTPQEQEIAMLAAAGLTNKQIGQRLFLSHKTIGNHLFRIFPKLGITSRAALRDALGG
jgi:DNA-binding CsgD family transcriptional regulator